MSKVCILLIQSLATFGQNGFFILNSHIWDLFLGSWLGSARLAISRCVKFVFKQWWQCGLSTQCGRNEWISLATYCFCACSPFLSRCLYSTPPSLTLRLAINLAGLPSLWGRRKSKRTALRNKALPNMCRHWHDKEELAWHGTVSGMMKVQ